MEEREEEGWKGVGGRNGNEMKRDGKEDKREGNE